MKIFTWHIHGSYLYYLSQGNYDIYIPVNKERKEGYYGRGNTFPFGNNVHEVPDQRVREMDFDLILFQTDDNYLKDQFEILSEAQRMLPRIYLEHDPPWDHPTNASHPVSDPEVTVVHVTHFNQLMWDNHGLKTEVIEHGVTVPGITPVTKVDKGIVVINNLSARDRLLGADIYKQVRFSIPLDLVGMGTDDLGLGEVLHPQLPQFVSQYRFFFNPIRYTSLGLAVCEAMMLGLPIVALATTEMAVTIENGYSGYIHTNIGYLIEKMDYLIQNPEKAEQMGRNARGYAMERFNIARFIDEWEAIFEKKVSEKIILKQV